MPLTNEQLLARLPQDAQVVDCAECGHLTTGQWHLYKTNSALGLRLLGGWKHERSGHRRPHCVGCRWAMGLNIPGPGEHRPEGQGVPIWREMGRL